MAVVPTFPDAVPAGWYLAALPRQLRAGEPLGADVAGEAIVLLRDRDGAVHAVPAGSAHPPATPLPCREELGAVFVRLGGGDGAFPSFSRNDPGRLRYLPGRRETVRAPWLAVVSNAFDVLHLPVVHRRALVEPPSFETLGHDAFRLRYVSRPTGSTFPDRLTGALSGGRVESTITAWGAGVVVVETRAGRAETALVIGIRPRGERTEVLPVVGVRRTGIAPLDAVSARLALWLYTRFLSPDLPILDGIRFEPRLAPGENPPLAAFLGWASRLPERA